MTEPIRIDDDPVNEDWIHKPQPGDPRGKPPEPEPDPEPE